MRTSRNSIVFADDLHVFISTTPDHGHVDISRLFINNRRSKGEFVVAAKQRSWVMQETSGEAASERERGRENVQVDTSGHVLGDW
jgi:hypothetical protein